MFPTSREAYSLRLMQITFAPSQLVLGAFAIFNISIYSVPFDDVFIFVAQGVRTEQEPTVLSVEAAQSCFGLPWFAGSHDELPRTSQAVKVVRMKRNGPPPILGLFRGETHKIKVMLVKEIGRTVWTSRPRQRGDRADDQVKIMFACPQVLLGPLAIFNVRQDSIPLENISLLTVQRHGTN